MTTDEALEVIVDEVTGEVLQEVLDNGLWDSYLEADLSDQNSIALRDRLRQKDAARPDPGTLSDALRHLSGR